MLLCHHPLYLAHLFQLSHNLHHKWAFLVLEREGKSFFVLICMLSVYWPSKQLLVIMPLYLAATSIVILTRSAHKYQRHCPSLGSFNDEESSCFIESNMKFDVWHVVRRIRYIECSSHSKEGSIKVKLNHVYCPLATCAHTSRVSRP